MKKRKLGTLEVSAIGMGCMGFTHAYGAVPAATFSIRRKCIRTSRTRNSSARL